MDAKVCFKCGVERSLSDFYKHPMMADGHLGKCKECAKKDIQNNTKKNHEYYRDYDKKRAMLPHRIAARKEYMKTEAGKAAKRRSNVKWGEKFPLKKKAAYAIMKAIKGKRITKSDVCEICGSSGFISGHHNDYTKPLDVVWLCRKCHCAWHKKNKAFYPHCEA